MRSVTNKSITVKESVEVVKVIATEKINLILEDKVRGYVQVEVSYYDDTDKLIETVSKVIKDENYALLMSASPSFAPGKPANEYREVDLWYVIDMM